MTRRTKIDLTIMYFEEANEMEHRERRKAWKWREDDMANFKAGIEGADDQHLERLYNHWRTFGRARSRAAALKQLDRDLEQFQRATMPYWGDLGPGGALS